MPVVEQSNPHPPTTTAASAPARLLRGFPAGPRTVTLSFGCHCHPASASQVRSALVWPGWGWGGWVGGLGGGWGGQAYAGGTREELTLQRGSWKPRRQKTGDETEGGRARRGDIWCSRPFQTPFQTLRTGGVSSKHRPQQPSAQPPLIYKIHLFILMLLFF